MDKLINIKSGTKFGKWEVLHYAGRKSHSSYWLCVCECGEFQSVDGYILRNNKSKQCTKCKIKVLSSNDIIKKRKEISRKKWGTKAAENEVFYTYKINAKKRNLSFDLSREEFNELIKLNCHYCDANPSNIAKTWNELHGFIKYSGIDRKDNNTGYIKYNCLPCCSTCNKAKLQMSYEDFISWIHKVYNKVNKNA